MIIRRIEHIETQLGLYRASHHVKIDGELWGKLHYSRHAPSPRDEKDAIHKLFCGCEYSKYSRYYFGFASNKQMAQWMYGCGSDVVNALIKTKAFQIVDYSIDGRTVVKGDHQCVFIKSKAEIVDKQPFSTIVNYKDLFDDSI